MLQEPALSYPSVPTNFVVAKRFKAAVRQRTVTAEPSDVVLPTVSDPGGASSFAVNKSPPVGQGIKDRLEGAEDLASLLGLTTSLENPLRRAEALLARYGTFQDLLKAAESEFLSEEELSHEEASVLRAARLVVRNALRLKGETGHTVIGCRDRLHDYLRLLLSAERREIVYLLFLNSGNQVIAEERHSTGHANHTPLYPREIIKRALVHEATALIIVHNHPSGNPTPSEEDLQMTGFLDGLLRQMGIALHDHVIVGKHSIVSLRDLQFVGEVANG